MVNESLTFIQNFFVLIYEEFIRASYVVLVPETEINQTELNHNA